MRRLVYAAAAVLLSAGCTPAKATDDPKPGPNAGHNRDISCLGQVDYPRKEFYDLDGDGNDEEFLIMRCQDSADPKGDQLEVISGDLNPDNGEPNKLVLQFPPRTVDALCFSHRTAVYRLTAPGRQPQVWKVKWAKNTGKPGKPTSGGTPDCAL